jgi:hypothetical protein
MKRCPQCGEVKPATEFYARRPSSDATYLRAYCKSCIRSYRRDHYRKNKAIYIKHAKCRNAKIRDLIRSAKDKPCADCGRTFPYYVMEFDHRDGEVKCFNIADVMGPRRTGMQRMLAEMAKCDVVCANCHRERTHQRKQNRPEKYRNKLETPELAPDLLP